MPGFHDTSQVPISFATVSIGCKPEHSLPAKIDALASAGFKGIELGFPDLQAFASQHLRHNVEKDAYDELCSAARVVKSMCDAKGLAIMLLQPFANFEGWPEDSPERREAFARANGWIQIMLACGCETLQVGSSDTPTEQIGTDRSRFAADLQRLADMLAEHKFRLAYENWCWSTHAPDWADVFDIVQKVDRPNIGLCLDTFQTGGGEWADPTNESGVVESAGRTAEQVQQDFRKSLAKLSRDIPANKIYLLQISDAYRMSPPMSTELGDDGTRPRGRWSHDYRPLPFNGGYLPVVDICKSVLETGFRGWFSYEVFDSGRDGKGLDYDLSSYANAAAESHAKLMDACAL